MSTSTPPFVALDANVWLAERLLRSKLGATLLYALSRVKGTIVLPATTRQEIINGVVRDGTKAAASIQQALGVVQSLRGSKPDIPLPEPNHFAQAAESRLNELGTLVMAVEHSQAHMEAALQRVLHHRAPAHKEEEFRDALFWELVSPLAQNAPVFIVSADSAFYEGGKVANGLAAALNQEVLERGLNLRLLPTVAELLGQFGDEAKQVDQQAIAEAIESGIFANITRFASTNGFTLGARQDATVKAFVTERLGLLAVSYELRFDVDRLPEALDGAVRATLVARGNAGYNLESGSASDIQLTKTEILGTDGAVISGNATVYASGLIVFGTREVPYTLRHPLD